MIKKGMIVLWLFILIGCQSLTTMTIQTSTETITEATTQTITQATTQTTTQATTQTTTQATTQTTTRTALQTTTTESRTDHMTTNETIQKLKPTETLDANTLYLYRDTFENLILKSGVLKQEDYQQDGIYISRPLPVEDVLSLVMSWNALIDENSKLTFSVALGASGVFSDFFIMGYWTEDYKSSFPNQDHAFADLAIDTLVPNTAIDSIIIKCLFKASSTDQTALKNISITTKTKERNFVYETESLQAVEITVPTKAQLSVPNIGRRICSPTSLAMILAYYGHDDQAASVAEHVYDEGASIYGNWTFNASYAGGFNDLYARVEYIDQMSVLNQYLLQGIPLALSIKTQHLTDLDGSIMAYPSGHLVVLTGFKMIDGTWYGLTNDPAAYTDSEVERTYLLSELMAAWTGYTYVINDSPFS